jgi:hypothetical protein
MKKLILLFSALTMGTLAFGQRPTHLIVDYDTTDHVNRNCIAGVGGNGGTAFTGGNMDAVGYADMGSEDAIYFLATPGTLDPMVTPYYMYIEHVNGLSCEPMAYTDSIVNIDGSGIVKITAKAGVTGVQFEFFVGFAHSTGFPSKGTYQYASLTKTVTVTNTYATYTVDWSGDADWHSNMTGGDSVNVWGVRMLNQDDEVWIQKIEFGSSVTGIKNPTLTKGISVYPNPGTGNITVNTYNRTGKVIVTNPLGTVIETIETSGDNEGYLLSNISDKGIYFLNFITTEGNATEKLVIE